MQSPETNTSWRTWWIGGGVGAAALLAVAGGSLALAADETPNASAQVGPLPGSASLPSFAPIAERLAPSVVSINVIQRIRLAEGRMAPFQFFFGSPFGGAPFGGGPEGPAPQFENRGSGSGVIVGGEGLILTNAHVVKDASEMTVQLSTGESVPAELVGLDEATDLALIRVRTERELVPAVFGNSDQLRVGDWVVAVGNPFGLEHTVTAGIVSAKERREPGLDNRYASFIQTDASINPGNSGGPLFNLQGEVVGINTAINAAGQGIGFAIPSNMARMVLEQLEANGRVVRSWLGVTIQTVTPELAESFGLGGRPRGALVNQTVEGSPSARAGLRAGDIILRFGEAEIGDSSELPWLASVAGVGEVVTLQVWRDGAKRDLRVTLEEMPEEGEGGERPVEAVVEEPAPAGLGIRVGAVPDRLRGRLDVPEGGALVEEVEPGGAAADHGLRPGDVIVEIDGRTVSGPEDVQEVVRDHAKADVIRLRVRGPEGLRFVGIRLR